MLLYRLKIFNMTKVKVVPCNGCTECCRFGDSLHLKYDSIPVDKNGDCIYLGKSGCTIWPNCPAVELRDYDCIKLLTHYYKEQVPERLILAAVERAKRV